MAATPLVLVHGGLYEDVDATRFWGRTGIGTGLRTAGFAVHAPARPVAPRSWEEERDALLMAISSRTTEPVALVAASNGCSVALRAVIDMPGVARALVLCWPATAGDGAIDAAVRERIIPVAGGATADRLLAGQTVRGVLDDELEHVGIPVAIVPSEVDDPVHQRATVQALYRYLPQVMVLEPAPPALRPNFRHYRARFIANLEAAITGERIADWDDWRAE
jgi:hypothetical protein